MKQVYFEEKSPKLNNETPTDKSLITVNQISIAEAECKDDSATCTRFKQTGITSQYKGSTTAFGASVYVVGLDADTELKRLTAVFERLVVGVHKVTWIGPSKVQVQWNRQLTDGEIHIKIAAARNELWYELGQIVAVRLVCRTDTSNEDKAAKVEDEQQRGQSPEKEKFQLF